MSFIVTCLRVCMRSSVYRSLDYQSAIQLITRCIFKVLVVKRAFLSLPLTDTKSLECSNTRTCSGLTELVLLAIRFNLDCVVRVEL